MGIPQKSLVIGACEIACHYPELSLNDAAGDALQLADKDLTPQKAVEKALRLWDIIEA